MGPPNSSNLHPSIGSTPLPPSVPPPPATNPKTTNLRHGFSYAQALNTHPNAIRRLPHQNLDFNQRLRLRLTETNSCTVNLLDLPSEKFIHSTEIAAAISLTSRSNLSTESTTSFKFLAIMSRTALPWGTPELSCMAKRSPSVAG